MHNRFKTRKMWIFYELYFTHSKAYAIISSNENYILWMLINT